MKYNPQETTYLNGSNGSYLEALYQDYLHNDGQVNGEWAKVFSDLPVISAPEEGDDAQTVGSQAWLESSSHKQAAVSRLIMAYRSMGHLLADVDPIGVMPRGDASEVELEVYDLSEADLESVFDIGNIGKGGRKTLREILVYLKDLYCGPIGYEIRYLNDMEQRFWLRKRVETWPVRALLSNQERISLLKKLTAAEGLEQYLHNKYVGQKRFSLEGGDVLIPMLSDMIQQLGHLGAKELVIGMAHRGRLNVLVNILGKAPRDLFSEFEGVVNTSGSDTHTGDVKYHQGVSSDIITPGGNVHVALSFNPSHLEIIDPVVEGSVRARQERRRDDDRKQVIPVLIHGDAAFAGQGVVMETLNMARTHGYSTGGTIHVIINNQIGFTTNTHDARSTLYCTEVAKMVQAPIFHINGDDPDAVVYATRLAVDYRMKFGGDVILDIVCYRRYGHNEADEPMITQPVMYNIIRKHPTPRRIYADRLCAEGVISEAKAREMVGGYRAQLDQGHVVAGQMIDPNKALKMVDWTPFLSKIWDQHVSTAVDVSTLIDVAKKLRRVPDDFVVHPRVARILGARSKMAKGKQPMDWGCAEMLAYATLLKQGFKVRLSGQDVGRGTFSHRHVTLHSQSNADIYIPMQYLADRHSDFLVIDSLLSEEAVLGFEYGYATTAPQTLVTWEAQFGDFVNGAQVVIDQFISSGGAKWERLCALTMLLPHGLEGQGPEHSSGRLERFLQLCADQNIQVCVPTTPAQMFHLLRRQMLRSMRRPLVVMTPKSLLRHKLAVSSPADLSEGEFKVVIAENDEVKDDDVKRVILCSGKVYYDLLEERRNRQQNDVAIIRLEQLYPFPQQYLDQELARYQQAEAIVWCQEEALNQGAWYSIHHHLRESRRKEQRLIYAGRDASPSPAVGYYKLHVEQQTRLVNQALTID